MDVTDIEMEIVSHEASSDDHTDIEPESEPSKETPGIPEHISMQGRGPVQVALSSTVEDDCRKVVPVAPERSHQAEIEYDLNFEEDIADITERTRLATIRRRYAQRHRVLGLFGGPEKRRLLDADGRFESRKKLSHEAEEKLLPAHECSDWHLMSTEEQHIALLCTTLLDSKQWVAGAIAKTDRIYKHIGNRNIILLTI